MPIAFESLNLDNLLIGTSAVDKVAIGVDEVWTNNPNILVANDRSSNKYSYSGDGGISWTTAAAIPGTPINDFLYNSGFYFVSRSGDIITIYKSSKGSDLSAVATLTVASADTVTCIEKFGSNIWLGGVSDGVATVWRSSNAGATWTKSTPFSQNRLSSLVYGNGVLVACTMNLGPYNLAYSNNLGATWTDISWLVNNNTLDRAYLIDSLNFTNGEFILCGHYYNSSDDSVFSILRSTNGVTWERGPNFTTSSQYQMGAKLNKGSIYEARARDYVAYSIDFTTWTKKSAPDWTYAQVVFDGTQYIMVVSTKYCYTSPDLITWTRKGLLGQTSYPSIVEYSVPYGTL